MTNTAHAQRVAQRHQDVDTDTDTDTQRHQAAWEARPEAVEGAEGVEGSQNGCLMVLLLLPQEPDEAQGCTRGSTPQLGCHRWGSQEKGPSLGRASSKGAQEDSRESPAPTALLSQAPVSHLL